MPVNVNVTVFRDVAPCSLVERHQCLEGLRNYPTLKRAIPGTSETLVTARLHGVKGQKSAALAQSQVRCNPPTTICLSLTHNATK